MLLPNSTLSLKDPRIQLGELGKFRLKAQNVSDAVLRLSKSCDSFLTLPITQCLQILVEHFWLLTSLPYSYTETESS